MITKKTAAEISDSIISSIETSLNQNIPLFPKAFNRVLAKTLGGVWVLLYQFASFCLLQTFVRTASNKPISIFGKQITPLKEHGAAVGVYQGTGQVTEFTVKVSVLNQFGTLASGTRIINTTTEKLYYTIGDTALNAAYVYPTVRATDPGEDWNVIVSDTLSFVSAQANVAKSVTVETLTVTGVDAEDTDTFRRRVMDRYSARPQGGAYADYRYWGQSVVGVKRIFPYSGGTTVASSAGQCDVYVQALDNDGIPTQQILDDVKEYIEGDEDGMAWRRPVNSYVTTYPISLVDFDVTIGAITPDNADTRTAIEEGINSYFAAREPWITGLSVLPRIDIIASAEVAGIVARIAASKGAITTGVTVKTGGSTTELYTLGEGELANVSSIVWPS